MRRQVRTLCLGSVVILTSTGFLLLGSPRLAAACTYYGDNGDNTFDGCSGDDVAYMYGGEDVANGLTGADKLWGMGG